MESNITKIEKYKSWGFNLTPANYTPTDKSKDKHPVCKKGDDGKYTWNVKAKKVWTDEELAAALETKPLNVSLILSQLENQLMACRFKLINFMQILQM